MNQQFNRRNFIRTTLSAAAMGSLGVLPAISLANENFAESIYMIGPMEGYSPQIGTLVSMLNYNRATILQIVKGMTIPQLDFLLDDQANTIGGLLMHLAATEKYYQVNTFQGRQDFNADEKKMWNAASELGDLGRKEIKGKELSYYLDLLESGRKNTLQEFKKKDDKWLLAVDPVWSKEEKLNTYWKWFHVCEHEANHRGQISFLKSRMPGARKGGGEG
ncbi:mycothiol transferase [Flavitalea antarctica]